MVVEPTPLSANNPRIASLRRLTGRRKARLEAGRFVIEGPVPILELLTADAVLDEVYVDLDRWTDADDTDPVRVLVGEAQRRGTQVWGLTGSVFASVSDAGTPQGVLALVERVPAAIAEALDELRRAGRTLVATVVHGGVAPEDADLSGPVAVVVGSEAHGLSDPVRSACDVAVSIPMAGSVESINAAIAGAVLLFEAARQRRGAREFPK